MGRWSRFGIAALGLGCAPAKPPPEPAPAPAPQPEVPPATAAGLVLFNPTETEITPYRGYLVSLDGSSGTLELWPDRYECPDAKLELPALAAHDGRLALDPPTQAYGRSGCEAASLPAGDYVVRIDSGYGGDLYAAGAVTVPMAAPIELAFENRYDTPWRCDDALARRAATLAVASARFENRLPDGFLDGCDLSKARCAASAEPPPLPPVECTVTLAEGWLRIERPAGGDEPRTMTASIDREAVYAQMIDVDRTSAALLTIDGKSVVVAGESTHEMHEHGGDAAKISSVQLAIDNPLGRALSYRVKRIEYLVDYSCGLPSEVQSKPKLDKTHPAMIEPGRSNLWIGFETQDAYQGSCDRFATRVTLTIERQTIAVTSEHQVTRIEPMREF